MKRIAAAVLLARARCLRYGCRPSTAPRPLRAPSAGALRRSRRTAIASPSAATRTRTGRRWKTSPCAVRPRSRLQDGYQWFRVVTRSTELVDGRRGGGTSVGVGGTSGSYGSGVGVGIGFDLSPDTRKYESSMEILLGKGPKPDDANAYDASSVMNRLS